MVKFFIPNAKDETQAEEIYQGIKKFAADQVSAPTDRRIFRIEYQHDGKPSYAEVGKNDPVTKELVMAILEGVPFMVCTPNRGVLRGIPVLVGKDEITDIQDFG